jgi:flagellar assembly protein FliH
VSCSRHSVRFDSPLREAGVRNGLQTLISEEKLRQQLEVQFQKGFESGQKALSEQLIEQRSQLLAIQSGVLRSVERALPEVIAECEKSIVLLAMETARRVVEEIPISAEMVEGAIKKALAELQQTAEYEVLVNPEDFDLLQSVQSGLLPPTSDGQVRFRPDSRVSRGGCRIHTRHGSIEATREKMFEKLESAVLC